MGSTPYREGQSGGTRLAMPEPTVGSLARPRGARLAPETPPAPPVSVIVPVYNGGAAFARCLDALYASAPDPAWELIVVDDGSTDGSDELARRAGARVLASPRARAGPATARNLGATVARGEFLFFVDADVTVRPETIGLVLRTFRADPGLSALFGSYDDRPSEPNFLSQYKNLFHHYVHQTSHAEATTFWTGCGAIRRDVFLAVGGFDTSYERPCIEDIELGYRLARAGHRVRLCHDLQVQHLKRWTAPGLLRTDIRDRGIPWTRLLLRERVFTADLNLQPAHRLSVVAVCLLGLLLPFLLVQPLLLGVAALLALALLGLNAPLYRFFLQRRGPGFLLAAIPWHWLYYAYSGLCVLLGTVAHVRAGSPLLRQAREVAARQTARVGGLRARWRAEDAARPAWQGQFWAAALAALLLGVALRLGAADWYTDYPARGVDGAPVALPNTFAAVDHPFHLERARATDEALRGGWLPRWFADHQGGYPAEFYPSGGAVVVALAYALGLGFVPLAIAYKLVVIATLLLPPLAYWALARRDRLPGSVALLAAALHLFVPGAWVAGGGRELLDGGLFPNVLASYLPLFVLLWGADWLRRGDRRGLLLATGAATLALYVHPRSAGGIAAVGAALALATLAERPRLAPLLARLAFLAALVGLLGAALLLPLLANQSAYRFPADISGDGEHAWRFDSLRGIWDFANATIGWPLIRLAALGIVVGLLGRGFYGLACAILLPLSALLVALLGWWGRDLPLLAQVEGPRLMPLLRPAVIFLAALGVHEGARAALRLLLLLAPASPLPREARGLPRPLTTDSAAFAAIADSALALEAVSTPADKALVLDGPLSTHASFWVPVLSDRAVYHRDWLWFWRQPRYAERTALRDEGLALDPAFLARHGLTFLLIDAARADLIAGADARPGLRRVGAEGGAYAIYRLAAMPGEGLDNGWVAFGAGAVTSLDARPERLTATGYAERAGAARLFVQSFPRWRAEVNGRPVPLEQTAGGYLAVPVPAGDVTVRLTYATAPGDWAARGLVALGALLLLASTIRPDRWSGGWRRWAPRGARSQGGRTFAGARLPAPARIVPAR